MIDMLSLLISHGLILMAAWRLLSRDDLDHDPEAADDAAKDISADTGMQATPDA